MSKENKKDNSKNIKGKKLSSEKIAKRREKSLKKETPKPEEVIQGEVEETQSYNEDAQIVDASRFEDKFGKHLSKIFIFALVLILIIVGFFIFKSFEHKKNDKAASLFTQAQREVDYKSVIDGYDGSPAAKSSYLKLYEIYKKTDKQKASEETLEDFIKLYQKNELLSEAYLIKASKLIKDGKNDEALKILDKSINTTHKSGATILASIRKSDVLYKNGKYDESLRFLENLVISNPGSPFIDIIDQKILNVKSKTTKQELPLPNYERKIPIIDMTENVEGKKVNVEEVKSDENVKVEEVKNVEKVEKQIEENIEIKTE